jgi:hypothetical protein
MRDFFDPPSATLSEAGPVRYKAFTGYVFKESIEWDWRDLRDYVADQIFRINGSYTGSPVIEASIFKGFLKRHGEMASLIARYAFEILDGVWYDEPIDINQFCKNSDPHFGNPIKQLIEDAS